MRILSLIWGYSTGGIGKCVLTYDRLKELPGFNVHTACIQLKCINHSLEPLKDIDSTIIYIKNRRDFSWVGKCCNLIDKYQPDLLFVHGFNGPVIAKILQYKLKNRLPFLCSYHGLYYSPQPTRRLVAPVFNSLMLHVYKKNASGIVAVSTYSKKELVSKGVPPEKISVVHNGLADCIANSETACRKTLNLSESDILIGTVTRLDPFKGLDHLLKAFSSYLRSCKNAYLVIIGEGPFRGTLEKLSRRLDIFKNVHFVGYQSNINSWFSEMDIFILPSLFENHSIALLEAMRAAKPIIATDVGGNAESVQHEKEALIVPPADIVAMEFALNRMIGDHSLRYQLAVAARKRFEQEFTEQRMLEKLANWFKSFENNL